MCKKEYQQKTKDLKINIYLQLYMNKKICKKIIENKDKFIPLLFTVRQIDILERYLNKIKLSKSEKTYLYSTIKKKVDALSLFEEEYYMLGENMLEERVKKAKNILKSLNKEKAYISGSFLYSEKYNDIDIYIISKKRKQYHRENMHFIFITQKDLKKPIFNSTSQYSVSNFFIEKTQPLIKKPNFNDIIITYEIAINEMLDNDEQKTVKEIVFEYYLHVKGIILDSFSLYKKTQEIIKLKGKEKIEFINKITKELLLKLYSNKYLYNELAPFVKRLKEDINNFSVNENLIIYHNLLEEVKNESRSYKAET